MLDQFPSYAKALSFNGALLISGFYIKDIPILKERAEEFGLQIVEEKEKDTWCALKLKNEQKAVDEIIKIFNVISRLRHSPVCLKASLKIKNNKKIPKIGKHQVLNKLLCNK